jgi:lipoate-protein ligase A
MPSWPIEQLAGDVGAFHARPLGDRRSATFFSVDSPVLVLGSAQRDESVDAAAASRLGIAVARRRSGGGGVLLWPGEQVWLDVEIPASDVLWDADVGRSMWWVGELWRSALLPFVPLAAVHHGRLQSSPWSADVCFAGVGPGEVLIEGAKLVGISQRRTRHAARFQSMVHLHWRPDVVAALAGGPESSRPTADDLAALVATCNGTAEAITSRLIAALNVM